MIIKFLPVNHIKHAIEYIYAEFNVLISYSSIIISMEI